MSQDKPDNTQAVRQTNQSFFFQSDIFRAGRLLARRARPGGVVHEPARAIPVFRDCDVLVVGGGPSGTAAAVAAARTGADVVLLERYNHLGGLSTGGLVIWIDRMTDWTGAQVIRGIANDLLDRLPKDAIAGPPRGLWGSADAATAAYWRERTAAYHGIVTWSPTIDPERLKLASQELVLESGVHLLLHGLGCRADHAGRRASPAWCSRARKAAWRSAPRVTVDCTGDGDIFDRAGAGADTDIEERDIHHCMNTSWIWGGVRHDALDRVQDRRRGGLLRLHGARPRRCAAGCSSGRSCPGATTWRCSWGRGCRAIPRWMSQDLTEVEVRSHRLMAQHLDVYRAHAPGFEARVPDAVRAAARRAPFAAAAGRGARDARALERCDAVGGRDRRVAVAVAETAAGVGAVWLPGAADGGRAAGGGAARVVRCGEPLVPARDPAMLADRPGGRCGGGAGGAAGRGAAGGAGRGGAGGAAAAGRVSAGRGGGGVRQRRCGGPLSCSLVLARPPRPEPFAAGTFEQGGEAGFPLCFRMVAVSSRSTPRPGSDLS